MSTASTRRTRRRSLVRDPYDVSTRRRRKSWLPLGMVGGLLVLGWFSPMLVAHTSLRDKILASVADVNGRVSSSGASLGWLSAVSIDNFEVFDKRGDRVLHVQQIQGDRALWKLLTQRTQLGHFQLVQPDVRVVLTDDGTNVEEVLRNWLNSKEPPTDQCVELDVVAGKVTVIDKLHAGEWQLSGCDATVAVPAGPAGAIACRAKGVAGAGTATGSFDVVCDVPAAEPNKPRLAKGVVKTQNFPLAMTAGIVRYFSPGAELDGRLTSELNGHWNLASNSPRDALLEGIIKTSNLRAAGSWLGDDELKLAQAEIPCRASWQGDQLKIERMNLNCDLGTASITGTLDTSKDWLAAVGKQPYTVKGQIKLAELARTLPHLVHLRDDTQIIDGLVNIDVKSQPIIGGAGSKTWIDGHEWQGQINTTQLVAQRDGKRLGWEKPVHIAFAAHESKTGTVIDRIYCEADFLELEGSGTPEAGQISGSYNLDRLSQELGRFVDLGDLDLAGSGWVHSTWKQDGNGRWEADAELQVNDFALARPNRPAWKEGKLEVAMLVAGDLRDGSVDRVDQGQLQVLAGGDRLTMRLLGPVAEFGEAGLWPLEIRLQGDLAKWQPRFEPWFDIPAGWEVGGDCTLAAEATWSPKTVNVQQLTAKLRRVRGWGHGFYIDEPEAEITGSAYWAGDRRRLEIGEVTLKSSGVSIQADDVVWAINEDGSADIRGLARYQGDLARLSRWLQDPAQKSEHELSGYFDGEVALSRTGSTTEARWQSTARNVSFGVPGKQPWKEPQIRLAGRGRHDRLAQKITLTSFELGSDALGLAATGEINDLANRRNLALDGNLRYDLAKLEPIWQRVLGSEVIVTGAETRAFSFRGPLRPPVIEPTRPAPIDQVVAIDRTRRTALPLAARVNEPAAPPPPASDIWLRQLTGQAGFGWQSIQVYGLGLGSGTADAALADGVLRVQPISVTASGGRVNLAPQVRLAPAPMLLTFAPGRVAERIQITPQMCAQALQYVAPVLAGVTQAQGAFSVQLDGAAIPVASPKQADVAGKLTVHSVDIGPGYLIQELAVLFNRTGTAKLQRESVVDFRLVEGRVYHRGLELVFPDVTIRTYGSVGLDQTVSLMAEMPVPPKWIGNNRLGSAIQNQTIRLPIGGTLNRPKIDEVAMQQVSSQFIRNAAGAAVEGEVQKQIDRQFQRLFGPAK
ncbi:MAG: hypothetical protein JNG90_13970 [Planctomycetaceae bacterium]|nr:hypothetical protein [Planctomycetaceae bacterium]